MRKYIAVLMLSVLLSTVLCGCDLWTDGFYVSDEPYLGQDARPENEVITASNYKDIRDALVEIVEDCAESAIISIPSMGQDMAKYYMNAAVSYIKENNAIGAFGVDTISYDVGTNAGEMAIAVDISYNYSRSVILRIKRIHTVEEAFMRIEDALEQYDAGITLYIAQYEDTDFTQMIQDFVDTHPELCMEMPQITVALYPEQGEQRVIDLAFTYRNSREVLRSMQENVQEVFSNLRISGESDWERYAELYTFLTERHDYVLATSITPPYSLLRHGVGDSKAFASVYAAMCQKIGLDCQVVSGTRAGEAWYWNVITEDDVHYHLDILYCREIGAFQVLNEAQMSEYVWDYSAFPIQQQEGENETTEATTEQVAEQSSEETTEETAEQTTETATEETTEVAAEETIEQVTEVTTEA